MKKYTIEVEESVKDAIVAAVQSGYKRAQQVPITYNDDSSLEEWVRVNNPELIRLKESTLLRYKLGFDYAWKLVEEEEEEDSAE
jgi:hypothetical protein